MKYYRALVLVPLAGAFAAMTATCAFAIETPAALSSTDRAITQGELDVLVVAAAAWVDAITGSHPATSASLPAPSVDALEHSKAVSVSELKAAAIPFYDQLDQLGIELDYPWNAAAWPDDLQPATIGLAETAFRPFLRQSTSMLRPSGSDARLSADDHSAASAISRTAGANVANKIVPPSAGSAAPTTAAPAVSLQPGSIKISIDYPAVGEQL